MYTIDASDLQSKIWSVETIALLQSCPCLQDSLACTSITQSGL